MPLTNFSGDCSCNRIESIDEAGCNLRALPPAGTAVVGFRNLYLPPRVPKHKAATAFYCGCREDQANSTRLT